MAEVGRPYILNQPASARQDLDGDQRHRDLRRAPTPEDEHLNAMNGIPPSPPISRLIALAASLTRLFNATARVKEWVGDCSSCMR
jgi:hypothetical protein